MSIKDNQIVLCQHQYVSWTAFFQQVNVTEKMERENSESWQQNAIYNSWLCLILNKIYIKDTLEIIADI